MLPALDTFTEASDTALSSHTSDSGHSWAGANIANFTVRAAEDELSIDGNSPVALVASPANADYFVEVLGKTTGTASTDRFGAVARYVDTSQGYQLVVFGSTGAWSLDELGVGVLASGSISGFSASTYYTLRVTCAGSNIRASIDGVEVANVTDATYSAAANPGAFLRGTGRISLIAANHGASAQSPRSAHQYRLRH